MAIKVPKKAYKGMGADSAVDRQRADDAAFSSLSKSTRRGTSDGAMVKRKASKRDMVWEAKNHYDNGASTEQVHKRISKAYPHLIPDEVEEVARKANALYGE